MTGLGPFDLTAGPFLALYCGLLVLAGIASLLLPRILRGEGRPGRINGLDELALLSGGPVRLAEAATARLLADGSLVQAGRSQFVVKNRSGGQNAVERAILAQAPRIDWASILRVVRDEHGAISRRLAANGLMLDRADLMRLRLIAAAPLFAVLTFGAIKLFIGIERGKPVGFLIVLLILTGLLALARLATIKPATSEGMRLIAQERARNERMRRAPLQDEMGASVAMFGTAVLAGSALSEFDALRRRSTEGDGGSGCGDGGGGCGGGCGGCGG